MINLLLAATAVALLWVPVGMILYTQYARKFELEQDAEFNVTRDMKGWAGLAWLALAMLDRETLLILVGIGCGLESYLFAMGETSSLRKLSSFFKEWSK
jgi:hypothetical protein